MAGSRCQVSVLVMQGETGCRLADDSDDDGEWEDYRSLKPELFSGDGPIRIITLTDFPSRSSEDNLFWVDARGAWRDRACTRPLFAPAVAKKPARDAMADRVGRQRVESVEAVLREAVDEILGLKALHHEGFSWARKPDVVFRWANRRSHGGIHGITFGPARLAILPEEGGTFMEYAAFAGDPMIGHFRGTRKDCLRVLAAHEMAHWLQYNPAVTRPPGKYKEPHGSGFRKIYWILRDAMGLKANTAPPRKKAP